MNRILARSVLVVLVALLVWAPSASAQAQHLSYRFGPVTIQPGQNSIQFEPNQLKPPVDGYILSFTPNLTRTDGSIPGGPCFRLNGRVTAPEFFAGLKRIDFENAETVFRRGEEAVKEYPDELLLEFYFLDHLCPEAYAPGANGVPRAYLTREIVSKLRLNLYWKHGIDLRPVESVARKYFDVKALRPYAADATDLPERLQWSYVFAVPSAGVPLTDSLVLIVRTEDDRIAARVAARM